MPAPISFDTFIAAAAASCVEGEWPDIPAAPGELHSEPVTPPARPCVCTVPPESLAWCSCEARATLAEIERDLGREWLLVAVLALVGFEARA
jgi:hypothetical protein